MPVLPAVHATPPAADTPARATDAGSPQDTPAFSNVLSSQRNATTSDKTPAAPSKDRADTARSDAKKQDPLGPDETLALILDSTALPLMQPVAQIPATLRHQAGAARSGNDTATDAPAASRRGADATALLADAADTTDTLAAADATRSRSMRTGSVSAQVVLASATRAPLQAAETAAPAAGRAAATNRAGALPPTIADGKTALANTLDTALATTSATSSHPHAARSAAAPDALAGTQGTPLGATMLPATASATLQAPLQPSVSTPLGNPQWPQDFSRQVLNLVQSGTASGHTVTMHVNPPELGPIHITLHLGDSLTQASFVSPHANVRQALENALPHLEQQLAQAGLSLGQANVSDQQAGQQQFAQADQGSAASDGSAFSLDGSTTTTSGPAALAAAPRPPSRPDALVDTFV
ncbi:flagellar hook-length control protein FliK [Castellaniella sp.]|uniref:flagellar hook-length control protein FliK n=1 Tax=Castellaniella sp. TaxID=1955812 RepID=UPI002AFFBE99|nr:flagellar hook-length control protein FliK [Castellaniella sp.]